MPLSAKSSLDFRRRRSLRRGGFTLIEMLVSVVILVILMAIIFQIIQLTSSAYKQTTQSTGTMQAARVAFERMTRNISQATLNTYYSYYYSGTAISNYFRTSELQYVSGYVPVGAGTTPFVSSAQNATQVTHAIFFQAPLGVVAPTDALKYGNMGSLLNACGYFVMYGPDTSRPGFLNSAGFPNAPPNNSSDYRFRLMEYLQPSENLNIYTNLAVVTSGGVTPAWLLSNGLPTDLTQYSPNVHPLASNIVALIIMPEQFVAGTGVNGQANTAPVATVAGATASTQFTTVTTYSYDSAYYPNPPTGQKISGPARTSIQYLTNNQLPPLVKVVMVAIDEASGARLAASQTGATSIVPPALKNTYTAAGLFTNPQNLFTNTTTNAEGDLEKLEDILNATPGNLANNKIKCNYYVFQSDVIIRGAKWTSN